MNKAKNIISESDSTSLFYSQESKGEAFLNLNNQ